MRLTREDCATLDALVAKVNRDDGLRGRRFPHVGKPLGSYSQSDVVRLAIAEALSRRREAAPA